ncbi:MAG: general secretion pathway protein GspL [Paucibacter sp.]|nr:general secretion pathway protein GspL [Roseateles sp.]
MSTLLLLQPPRGRANAQSSPGLADLDWLLCDGRQISARGRGAPLPAAAETVLLLADVDVAWRRVSLPKAGRQMRQALAGLLEDALLEETDQVHFALPAAGRDDGPVWVACCSRPWLGEQLAALDAAQVLVDRVAPMSWPGEASLGHFENGQIHWSHDTGVASLSLEGQLARQLISPGIAAATLWTAAPSDAAAAQAWLGTNVALRPREQRALAALDGPWNLAQFEFAPRTRGLQVLRRLNKVWAEPQWRPLRWGLVALVLVQILGLNLLAWKEKRELVERRAALTNTLTQTFPKVRAVLDAPLQMRRETEALRVGAGQRGDADLESLLGAAAAAWPAGQGPVESFSFETGQLSLSSKGWNPAQIEGFGKALRAAGWHLESRDTRMTISRGERRP